MKSYIIIITLSVFAVGGCTSIEQPVASIELVQNQIFDTPELANQKLNNILNADDNHFTSTFNGQVLTLEKVYFSAAGRNCRYVLKNATKDLFCMSQNNQWDKITFVLSESGLSTMEPK